MRRPFSNTQRWHLLASPDRSRGHWFSRSSTIPIASLLVALVAILVALLVPSLELDARAGLAAVALVLLGLATMRRRRPTRGASVGSGTSIVADASGLQRTSPSGAQPIVQWETPFGVTLLASYGRPHALLAFTTLSQTRYVPTRIDGRTEEEDELFARISVLADLDLIDGVAHDAALSARDAAAIVRHVDARSTGGASGRIFLSDGKGNPIALDRATLAVGARAFDLTSQLEWRALMFHESTGQTAALYQATWIRQGAAEVVLVAPMPASIVPREPNAHREATGRLGRALTRDLRLLQTPAESPPARDVRVAIDRPFMLAVRRILDEAPLALRLSPVLPKHRSAARDNIA